MKMKEIHKGKCDTHTHTPSHMHKEKQSGISSYEMDSKHFDMTFLISLITTISLQVPVLHDANTKCLLSIYSDAS